MTTSSLGSSSPRTRAALSEDEATLPVVTLVVSFVDVVINGVVISEDEVTLLVVINGTEDEVIFDWFGPDFTVGFVLPSDNHTNHLEHDVENHRKPLSLVRDGPGRGATACSSH